MNKWNNQKECGTGKDSKNFRIKSLPRNSPHKILRIHRELEQDNKPIIAEILKRHYYGESKAFSTGMDIQPNEWYAQEGLAIGKSNVHINKQIENSA